MVFPVVEDLWNKSQEEHENLHDTAQQSFTEYFKTSLQNIISIYCNNTLYLLFVHENIMLLKFLE